MPNIPDQSQWPKHPLDNLVPDERPICYGVLKPGEYARDGVPLLRITDLEANTIDERNLYRINHALDAEFARSRLLGGELLLSIQGTIGRVAIVPPTLRAANISRTLARIALCNDANSLFYRHWFLSDIGQRALTDATVGTTRNSLNINALRAIVVPHPEISEQGRIAATLDAVDESIAKTEAVIAKLNQVRAGLLYDFLTRGLDENAQLRDPIAHPEQFQDSLLGRIPREWEIATLVSRIALPEGQVDPRVPPYAEWILVAPDHIESATGRLLATQTAAEQEAISGKYVFEPGDVVYSKIRPYLRKAILACFQGLCSADMYPLRPKAGINSRFLLAVILGEPFSRFASAVSMRSGFPKINREELAQFVTAWPKTFEQNRIADVLKASDSEQLAVEKELAKLQQLKSGLTNDLLTGRVRVPE